MKKGGVFSFVLVNLLILVVVLGIALSGKGPTFLMIANFTDPINLFFIFLIELVVLMLPE